MQLIIPFVGGLVRPWLVGRVTVGRCTRQGDYVSARLALSEPGEWRVNASAHGAKYCTKKGKGLGQIKKSCHISHFSTIIAP